MSEHHAMPYVQSKGSTDAYTPDLLSERNAANIFKENVTSIRCKYAQLEPALRQQRDRALALAVGVTEVEWVAAQCGDMQSVQLTQASREIISQIGRLGRVMALTRNPYCVAEKYGVYSAIEAQGSVGLVLGPDIDLRIFFDHCKHVWAVEQGGRHSLQFFDRSGQAIHKIYCTAESDHTQYLAIIGQYRMASPVWPEVVQYPPEHPCDTFEAREHRATEQSVHDRAPARLRRAWFGMKDTHDFYPLLKEFKITRLAALRAVGRDLAQRVAPEVVEDMLVCASRSGLPIMCFVSNRAMIQIHTGPVVNIERTGRWLNVLDPDFNLHLDTTRVDSVWIVYKPTADGWVTSLELFDQAGLLITQFFGARKPGTPELTPWRDLMRALRAQAVTQ